jgi:hypothetical protein
MNYDGPDDVWFIDNQMTAVFKIWAMLSQACEAFVLYDKFTAKYFVCPKVRNQARAESGMFHWYQK